MSISIDSSLDALKRQALTVILQSVDNKFPALAQKINDYLKTGSTSFSSLMNIINANENLFSSSFVNASMLTAYLDFYSLYTIMISNYQVFSQLKDISNSKYTYAYNLYKDSLNMLREKQALNNYSYSLYTSFMFPKNISIGDSKHITRSGNITEILNFSPVLTLPVESYEEITPTAIVPVYVDGTESSEINSNFDGINFNCDIIRSQGNKIGIVRGLSSKAIKHIAPQLSAGYTIDPEFSGSTIGYFTNELHVKVTGVSFINEKLTEIRLKGSTNGYEWSSEFTVLPGVFTKIFVEGDIQLGLSIKLVDGFGLDTGDRWQVTITNIELPAPQLDMKIEFNSLENVSFIQMNDISPSKLTYVNTPTISKFRYGKKENVLHSHNGDIGQTFVVGSTVDTFSVTACQPNYEIYESNGKLTHKYSFDLSDIKAVKCIYKQHGSIALNPMSVGEINSVIVEASDFVPSVTGKPSDTFIEYNVALLSGNGKVVVPILTQNDFVSEYVIPTNIENVNHSTGVGTAEYRLRFPLDTSVNFNDESTDIVKLYKATSFEELTVTYDSYTNKVIIPDYDWHEGYIVKYKPAVNSSSAIYSDEATGLWHKAGYNVYFMFYVDEDSKLHLALRSKDGDGALTSFTGTIIPQIEMRSMNRSSVTPMVFDYSISCV